MANIILFDLSNDGHHFHYNHSIVKHMERDEQFADICYVTSTEQDNLLSRFRGNNTSVHNIRVKRNKTGPLSLWKRTVVLARMLLFARSQGYDKVHLLHLDSLLLSLLLVIPLMRGVKVTGTLHWFPVRRLKQRVLSFLIRRSILHKVVVHGQFTQDKVNRLIGAGRAFQVCSIHFPSLHNRSRQDENDVQEDLGFELQELNRPLLLCFGGLRYDKGIDLLLEAASQIKDKDYTLIVAGSEDYFAKTDIDHWAEQYGIRENVYTDIKFIPESRMDFYFNHCDAVVLPYRALFTGQSGPLTEGAARNKFILGPDHGEIGHTIKAYGLGETFEAENIADLSNKLLQTIEHLKTAGGQLESNHNAYKALISPDRFGASYSRFLSTR
jgi:glycosyltransferase involved in cell wall biosynthesis